MALDGLERIRVEGDFFDMSRIAFRDPNVKELPMDEYFRYMEHTNGLTAGWSLRDWYLFAKDRFKEEHPEVHGFASKLYKTATSIFG